MPYDEQITIGAAHIGLNKKAFRLALKVPKNKDFIEALQNRLPDPAWCFYSQKLGIWIIDLDFVEEVFELCTKYFSKT